MATRSKDFLVVPQTEVIGSKLPSNREVLGVVLHRLQLKKTTLRDVTLAVTPMVAQFWDMARIPMIRKDNIVTKIEKLHREYELLKKGRYRRSEAQISKEKDFEVLLDNLFDVAHGNALTMMTNQEDKEFLLAQREPGRRGRMGGVDSVLAAQEARRSLRLEKAAAFSARKQEEAAASSSVAQLESSPSSSSNTSAVASDEEYGAVGGASPAKRAKRATKNIVSPALAATLDRTKLTDRSATYVLTEAARSLDQNVEELNINRSSIRRQRLKHRAAMASKIREEFRSGTPLVVHWDGKLMMDLTTKEHVDRLPIIISGIGGAQLLAVAKLGSGTGESMAAAVVSALETWGVADQVVGMSFDTTASNTGRRNGACVLIEQKMGKDLLHFACRHHILELVVHAVFVRVLGCSSSPELLLFKRFQTSWESIDREDFGTGIMVEEVATVLEDVKDEALRWTLQVLQEREDLRDDYRELVELVIIFLGGAPPGGIRFRAPGAMHHARWMSKVLYSFKIWMFRGQFRLTKKEERGLQRMCLFVVRVYAKAWIEASFSAQAPRLDLELIKALGTYDKIDSEIGDVALSKLSSHLWYVSEELVGLSFFDSDVSCETKNAMVTALRREEIDGEDSAPKRVTLPKKSVRDLHLEDFVSGRTLHFFRKLHLDEAFLDLPPDSWQMDEGFQRSSQIIRNLAVVNDHAERGVALIQEFNGSLTKDEEQLQFLLQVVADHRKAFPDPRKRTLAQTRPQ